MAVHDERGQWLEVRHRGGQFQVGLFAWVSSPYVSGNQSIYITPKGENIGQNYSRAGNPKVDALFPLWQPKRQALHDLAAKTQVVRRGGPTR